MFCSVQLRNYEANMHSKFGKVISYADEIVAAIFSF